MLLKKFNKSLKGATAIEYAIIASLLSVVIIIGVEATGVATKDKYDYVAYELESAFQTGAGGGNNQGGQGGAASPNLQPNPDGL
jgi:Flp pilus assembly pilin Flp